MAVYGYVRVSTQRQGKEVSGHVSIPIQKALMNRKYPDIDEIYEECVSGKDIRKQKELNKLMKVIKKGDTVVVYSLSRLTRDFCGGAIVLNKFRTTGVEFLSLSEGFTYNDYSNRLAINTLLATSTFQSEEISARVKASVDYRRQRGDVFGPPPFGMRVVRDKTNKRMFERDENEQKIIKKIVKIYRGLDINYNLAVISLVKDRRSIFTKIADYLNANNILYRNRNTWTNRSVKRVLLN